MHDEVDQPGSNYTIMLSYAQAQASAHSKPTLAHAAVTLLQLRSLHAPIHFAPLLHCSPHHRHRRPHPARRLQALFAQWPSAQTALAAAQALPRAARLRDCLTWASAPHQTQSLDTLRRLAACSRSASAHRAGTRSCTCWMRAASWWLKTTMPRWLAVLGRGPRSLGECADSGSEQHGCSAVAGWCAVLPS